MTTDTHETTRDATKSFKGYEFQYYYFIKLILKQYEQIDYIKFEGCEDIDILFKDGKYHCIQVKHYSKDEPKEGFGKRSGFTKVINAYMTNYNNTMDKGNVDKIVYFINNENKLHSPKFEKLLNNDHKISRDLLIKKYPNYENDDMDVFVNKLKVKNNDAFNVDDFFDKIHKTINTNTFFQCGNSVNYKKDIVLFRIIKETTIHIFTNNEKLYPSQLFSKIIGELKSEYTIDNLCDEIISVLGNRDNIHTIHIQKILSENLLKEIPLKKLYEMHTKTTNDNIYTKIVLAIIEKICHELDGNITNTITDRECDVKYRKVKGIISHMATRLLSSSDPKKPYSGKTCTGGSLLYNLSNINDPNIPYKTIKRAKDCEKKSDNK